MFEIGVRVVIHGMDGKEGAEAEISAIDSDSATYECKLLADDFGGEKVYCKAANLKLASDAAAEDPDKRLADLVKDKGGDRSSSEKSKGKSKKKSKKKKKRKSSSSSSPSSSSRSSSTNAPNRKKRGTMFNRSTLEVAEKAAKRHKKDREGGAAAAAALLGLR
ncbi:unnamed protein product [Cladocopium goreaui]|uniref:Uncharacterized protein n=1 Tax=Cladocopium goreaui TaxID=2562237 RepID=A0A9P1GB22_9DINO|nr:unnamed protein product [Cladocopium goreaui]